MSVGGSTPEDKQPSFEYAVSELWSKGKFWEIFGFNSNDFTALELAKKYSALRKLYRDSLEEAEIVESAFAVLNAPLTRQFYAGSRAIMQRIRGRIGASRFEEAESQIWSDLWGWVSKRWQAPPDELVTALENKYAHGAVAEVAGIGLEEESLGIDSVMAAEAFAREIRCQACGRFDHTLRAVAFPYVISILVASLKRFDESGIFCHRCRCGKSIKWAIVSLLFGWWSIWGFFWNIGVLIDNFRGGKMPRENNEPLVARLAWVHMTLGKIAEAKAALKDLLKYGPNEEAMRLRQELDRKYPSVALATTGGFRLGYLALVVAILAIYGLIGNAIFGGPSVKSPPIQPSAVTPSQPTPTPITEDLSSNLLIYLDENYTKLWDSANIPDLDSIPWSSPDSDGWQTGTLIVYLKNIGSKTIEVSASATESPLYAKIGFSVSSNTVILKPNEYGPITITIKQNPMLLSMSSSSTSITIYFHINAR